MSAPAGASVLLLAHGELGSGAYRAHLLALARRLSKRGREVHHVVFVGPRLLVGAGRRRLDAIDDELTEILSGRHRFLPHGPRGSWLRFSAWCLAREVARWRPERPLVVHARGARAALVGALARRQSRHLGAVLHDVRGDAIAEVSRHGGESLQRVRHELQQATGLADAHACVSQPLAELLRREHGVRHADVFPCAADTELFTRDEEARNRHRRELGLEGSELLLGFVGSPSPWQAPDALAAAFGAIVRARPDARLLVVSPAREHFARALCAAGLEEGLGAGRFQLRSAAHAEVPGWLSACDFTAVLRERDAVNAVASPIKLGESLACGVPVLVTAELGDASTLVEEERLGAVFEQPDLSGPGDEQRLHEVLDLREREASALSARCREAAVDRWSFIEALPRWEALHDRLAAGSHEQGGLGETIGNAGAAG
ncbi:MAG: glycosyltransferase [Acidobacteriota bacterium]